MAQDKTNQWFDKFDQFMANHAPDVVAETAVEHFRENFQAQAFDDEPWAPLSPRYARSKRRSSGRILTRTGALQASIRPEIVEQGLVRISAGNGRVRYARVHNEGFAGQVTVPTHVNRNFMGKGKAVTIRQHQKLLRIPKRQFMGRSVPLTGRINNRLKRAYDAY